MEIKEKRLVFVCSPLSGEQYEQNLRNACAYSKWLMTENQDIVAVAPHLLFTRFLDDSSDAERRLGMEGGQELLKACDEIYVFSGDDGITPGMSEEISMAEYFGKRITYIDRTKAKAIAQKF